MRLVRARHKGRVRVEWAAEPRPGAVQGDKGKSGEGCLTGI